MLKTTKKSRRLGVVMDLDLNPNSNIDNYKMKVPFQITDTF